MSKQKIIKEQTKELKRLRIESEAAKNYNATAEWLAYEQKRGNYKGRSVREFL